MKNALAVSLLVVTSSIVAVSTTIASPPTVTRTAIDTQFVDQSCGFAVTVHATGYIIDITWVLPNGSTRNIELGPQLRWILTNLETGKTITVNVAGPGQFTFNPDGSLTLVGTGTWGWIFNPDTLEPGLFRTAGRFVFSIDSAGNLTIDRDGGHLDDLCAQLVD